MFTQCFAAERDKVQRRKHAPSKKRDACISKSEAKNNQEKTTCPHATDVPFCGDKVAWVEYRFPHLTCKERVNRIAPKDSLESLADCALHWRNPFNRAVTSGPPTDDLCHPARSPSSARSALQQVLPEQPCQPRQERRGQWPHLLTTVISVCEEGPPPRL